jgi:hypothetical protein
MYTFAITLPPLHMLRSPCSCLPPALLFAPLQAQSRALKLNEGLLYLRRHMHGGPLWHTRKTAIPTSTSTISSSSSSSNPNRLLPHTSRISHRTRRIRRLLPTILLLLQRRTRRHSLRLRWRCLLRRKLVVHPRRGLRFRSRSSGVIDILWRLVIEPIPRSRIRRLRGCVLPLR